MTFAEDRKDRRAASSIRQWHDLAALRVELGRRVVDSEHISDHPELTADLRPAAGRSSSCGPMTRLIVLALLFWAAPLGGQTDPSLLEARLADELSAEMRERFEAGQEDREIEALQRQQTIDRLELDRQEAARRALLGGIALSLLVASLLYNRYRLKDRTASVIARQNRELEIAMAELKDSERERRRLEKEQVRREERDRYITDLEAKNDEIEARNAEMERFTYTLSHDLKSPLVTIRGFLGLLRRDALAGDRERMDSDLTRIEAAVHRMAQLLDELLEMLSVGSVVAASEEVPLGELAKEATEQLAEETHGRCAGVEIASDLPVVFGDRQRLLEVLRNLIGNALQFTASQPEPRVEVGWRRQGSENVFYVGDNGIGIEPRYHEKIFGLFERLNADAEGTGAGLALVRRIVEVHGGRAWAESEGLGRGSTFCFTLPRAPEADRAARRPRPILRSADYGKLFEHAHDAILILDPAGEKVLEANRRACELYGFERDEFIGLSMLELTPTHRRATDHVRPTLESRERHRFETIQRRKDSSEIRLEVHAATVEFLGRRAILSINRDVTRRRRQEEALARHRARLEEIVLSRAGRVIEQPTAVALPELVEETADLLSGVIGERGIELVVAADPPALRGDASRLGEVLQNLVENAVKYMGDQPAPRIEIGAHRDGEEIVVYVRDNGMGIDPGHQEKIFGFFERAEAGTARGMGIGLALTRRIVEAHGGRIWVESEGRGRGSTFKFTIPAPGSELATARAS